MDNPVFQDLMDYYANRYGLVFFVCDSKYNLVTQITGNDALVSMLLGDPREISNLMAHQGFAEPHLDAPLIYDVLPGLKSIVSAFPTPLGMHYVWAGVYIDSDTRELVQQYFNHHVADPTRWEIALESVPELTPDTVHSAMHRMMQFQSLVAAELGKDQLQEQEYQLQNPLCTVQNVLSCVMEPDIPTDELLRRMMACDKHIQLVGYAEQTSAERFNVRYVCGDSDGQLVGSDFTIGEGFLGYTAATGVPECWENAGEDPRAILFLRHGLDLGFICCYPLKRGNHVTAILFAVAQERLHQTTLDTLEVASAALNIHDLHQEFSNQLHDQRLQLSMMTELSRTMPTIQDLKNILFILLDMSLNLVQGKFSCLVFKPFDSDSVRVMSRGISSDKAAHYGQELIDLYFQEDSGQSDWYTPNLRYVWDTPVLECLILCHNRVSGVLAVAVSDEQQAERLSPVLSILSALGTVGLQRIQSETRVKHANEVFQTLRKAMSFWNPSAYELTVEASKLTAEFARHLGFKESDIETLTNAAFIEPYDPALIGPLMEEGDADILGVLRAYHMLDAHPAVQESTLASQGAQLLSIVFGHLRGGNRKRKRLSAELNSKFTAFLLRQETETQELLLPNRGETFSSEHLKGFTAREKQILKLLLRGLGNKDIASTLFISEHTVKNHLTNIFQKLGVSDRTHAIATIYQSKQ